jgi:hypothetical protein
MYVPGTAHAKTRRPTDYSGNFRVGGYKKSHKTTRTFSADPEVENATPTQLAASSYTRAYKTVSLVCAGNNKNLETIRNIGRLPATAVDISSFTGFRLFLFFFSDKENRTPDLCPAI